MNFKKKIIIVVSIFAIFYSNCSYGQLLKSTDQMVSLTWNGNLLESTFDYILLTVPAHKQFILTDFSCKFGDYIVFAEKGNERKIVMNIFNEEGYHSNVGVVFQAGSRIIIVKENGSKMQSITYNCTGYYVDEIK